MVAASMLRPMKHRCRNTSSLISRSGASCHLLGCMHRQSWVVRELWRSYLGTMEGGELADVTLWETNSTKYDLSNVTCSKQQSGTAIRLLRLTLAMALPTSATE